MYDVLVIGAGIIGTAIARELTRYKIGVKLIDKESDVSNGTTKANSAIIHSGYDAKEGTLMAKFNALGNPMFDKWCEELDVPFKRIGSLVIGFNEDDEKEIEELYKRGIKNKIPEIEIIDKARVKEIEPNINDKVTKALYSKTAGIVGPWELTIALAENAVGNGAEISLESEVKDIIKMDDYFITKTSKGDINSRYIINCAGVYADKINNMVNNPSFKIIPRRGQYYVMDKEIGKIVNSVIFQTPSEKGKGVLVAPTVHGNLLIGPDSQNIDDKEDISTTADRLEYIKETALKTTNKIDFRKTITTFAGLRAQPDKGDFIIEESETSKFINVAGIKSPGLSSAPAIAEYVADMVNNIECSFEENIDFSPERKQIVFMDLDDKEKQEIIKNNPSYGRIICRCENITEGEIIDAIRRPVGAKNVDGIKRRCRPGTGRCQGGFCGPRVQEILARELNKDMSDIKKDNKNSYILTEMTKG